MFGKKKEEEPLTVNRVPVYNVQSLPQDYEPIKLLHAVNESNKVIEKMDGHYDKMIDKLGELGYDIGADAVIGLQFEHNGGMSASSWHSFGTAIKFK